MSRKKDQEPASEVMPDVDESANGEGIYWCFVKSKTTPKNPDGRKLLNCGRFASRQEAIDMSARMYAKQLVRKITVEKE